MPDASGRFRGISVPELPWLAKKPAPKPAPLKPLTAEDWRDIANGRN